MSELQEKMESGELTARRLAELYLERIDAVDKNGPYLNSVIEVNPEALIVPSGGPSWTIDLVNGDSSNWDMESTSPAAVAGYPHITVPAGYLFGLPVGISFFAKAWQEPALIKFAYAFEQATQFRRQPRFLPTASLTP